MIEHVARLTPLAAETAWRIEGGALIQSRGKTKATFALADLTRLTLIPAGARRPYPSANLAFGLRRITIPSAGFAGRGVEPRSATFAALIRAIAQQASAASPKARFVMTDAVDHRSPLLWAIVLIGVGSGVMAMMSVNPAAAGIGLSLAARMAFVGLLLGAALPWMGTGGREFDPLSIPPGVLGP